jgi:asparagine synthase (glutamine-hydrolysing)
LFTPDAAQCMAAYDPAADKVQALGEGDGGWLSVLQTLDLKNYLPLDILTKVDRMSMAHSIEARVPLLDHKVVEFAATIPQNMRLKNGTTKYIFKQAMRGILPDAIIDRPKRGFAIPLGNWFRGKLGSFVSDLLLSPGSLQRGIFNQEYIKKLVGMQNRGRDLDLQLWTLISFEMWCREFLDKGTLRLPARCAPEPEAVQAAV